MLVVAEDMGLAGTVSSLQEEIKEMKEALQRLTAESSAEVIELRYIDYEQAKDEIGKYFEDHHGETIDAADLQEALRIDIELAKAVCEELERESKQDRRIMKKAKDCYREPDDCVEGDSIYVECRKPGNWGGFRMSGKHRGYSCKAQKNARGILLRSYTNIKRS